jgi:hypothetical protein
MMANPEPHKIAFALNDTRRHLSLAERAAAGAKMANLVHGDVKSQRHDAPVGASQPIVTREEAAKIVGVGKGTLDRAHTVLAKGDPETIRAMETGETTVNAAYSHCAQDGSGAILISEASKFKPCPGDVQGWWGALVELGQENPFHPPS